VAQRNLTVLSGPMPITALLAHLGGLVPEQFTLEVTHAGPQALGVLQAIGGGTLPGPKGEPMEVRVPELDEVRVGLVAGRSVHLLTAFTQDGRTVVARSDQLAEFARVKYRGRGLHPFERAGGTRRLLDHLDETVYETDDPEVVIAEFTSRTEDTVTGEHFHARYIQVLRIRDGQIVLFRDYCTLEAITHLWGDHGGESFTELGQTFPEA
jgi:ketosteroid isomerase-like protein